jgi:hypothetical protein
MSTPAHTLDRAPVLEDDIVAVIRAHCPTCRTALYVEATGWAADAPHGWSEAYRRAGDWIAGHQAGELDHTRVHRAGHAVTIATATTIVCSWYAWLRRVRPVDVEPGVYVVSGVLS